MKIVVIAATCAALAFGLSGCGAGGASTAPDSQTPKVAPKSLDAGQSSAEPTAKTERKADDATDKPAPRPKPKTPEKPKPTAKPEPEPVYYANCTEVRAAGAAPIRQGEPGYSTKLDRDRDGIACDT